MDEIGIQIGGALSRSTLLASEVPAGEKDGQSDSGHSTRLESATIGDQPCCCSGRGVVQSAPDKNRGQNYQGLTSPTGNETHQHFFENMVSVSCRTSVAVEETFRRRRLKHLSRPLVCMKSSSKRSSGRELLHGARGGGRRDCLTMHEGAQSANPCQATPITRQGTSSSPFARRCDVPAVGSHKFRMPSMILKKSECIHNYLTAVSV